MLRVSQAAKHLGVSPSAVRAWSNSGKLPHHINPLTKERNYDPVELDAFMGKEPVKKVAFYVRSSSGDKTLMKKQEEELTAACGEPVKVYWDAGSGLNENRRGLHKMLRDAEKKEFTHVYATYPDRVSRFGIGYVAALLKKDNVALEFLHDEKFSAKEELMKDFMSLIASFSGKFYRLRGKKEQKALLNDAYEVLNED